VQSFIFTSLSGWSLVVLTGISVSLALAFRRQLRDPKFRLRWEKGRIFLKRMRPHYWLGYAIAGITLVHAALALSSGWAKGANILGLMLAGLGMFLVFAQILLGRTLRRPHTPNRRQLRGLHLVLMFIIVTLGVGHILLDSSTLHSLLR
jgi:hypothetical protein